MLISFLIDEIMRKILNDKPVDVVRLDALVRSNNIAIREEHRKFIINFGNCNKLLSNGFSDFTLSNFEDYYLDTNLFDADKVPDHTTFLGSDFADELLCIDDITGEIYTYYCKEKDLYYYKDINSLLFYCLLQSEYKHNFFRNINYDIKINNIELFSRGKNKHRVDKIYIRYQSYYFIENKLYETDANGSTINVYEGGVLDYYQKSI